MLISILKTINKTFHLQKLFKTRVANRLLRCVSEFTFAIIRIHINTDYFLCVIYIENFMICNK